MTKFFHKTNFEFSAEAKAWILDRYKDRFDKNFSHNLDGTQGNLKAQVEWIDSKAGKELKSFLSSYNCNFKFFGITAHISNYTVSGHCNPHIDHITDYDGNRHLVLSRFNALVIGNPEDEMLWWEDVKEDNPMLLDVPKKNNQSGFEYKAKMVPGTSVEERIKLLGQPTFREKNVPFPSAFVKTDCMHSVILSSGPRLVITVAFDKSIEEITALNSVG